MRSAGARDQRLAAMLAALAGYVDATGFMATGGFFVSFMSGNSTRLGIGVEQGPATGAVAAGLIAGFLAGVVGGSLAGHVARGRRRPVVLGLVAVFLSGSAALGRADAVCTAAVVMAIAMGAINNVFERDGEVSIGVTYMTGSLVKLGQRIAKALVGTDRTGWIPYLFLWLGFVAGVALGAVAYQRLGLTSLWCAALVAAILAIVTSARGDDLSTRED